MIAFAQGISDCGLKLILTVCILCSVTHCRQPESNIIQKNNHNLPDPENYNAAFLIMDGVYNTELTAPFDIFHHTIFRDSIKPMNVFTVADTDETVTTFEGLRITPDFNYISDSLPFIDILIIPSAEHHTDSDLQNESMLEFVRNVSSKATYVMSHCDGAFVLAKAGVLDGFASTTFPGDIGAYKEMFPAHKVYEDVLFVHDDKFITSAGGAKSFEASLYLCEIIYGKRVADQIANGMVIDWDLTSIPFVVIDIDK